MTMLRDPFDHFVRAYEKKAANHGSDVKKFLFAPSWTERNVSSFADVDAPLSESVSE